MYFVNNSSTIDNKDFPSLSAIADDKLNNTGSYELPEDIDRIKEENNGQLNLF
jgi:hypothetical protein